MGQFAGGATTQAPDCMRTRRRAACRALRAPSAGECDNAAAPGGRCHLSDTSRGPSLRNDRSGGFSVRFGQRQLLANLMRPAISPVSRTIRRTRRLKPLATRAVQTGSCPSTGPSFDAALAAARVLTIGEGRLFPAGPGHSRRGIVPNTYEKHVRSADKI